MQGFPAPRLEITGVNASQLPTVTVSANVFDNVNQPITNLTAANFSLIGDLAPFGQIVDVQNITDQNLPIATVLVIDVSTSMEGAPFFAAKEAARAFVQGIGANDPVAILTFGTGTRLVQDYTTDKNLLLSAIDNLPLGGQTALYQAAYDGVQLAANSPVPRRAVVLLSDGAEYGGHSNVGRGAALEEAITRGVPVYTIGLGYGTDRTYLQELSAGTNARNYESPTPDQLLAIYSELATILRSQYVITLNLDLPADGTEYTLGLQVSTDGGVSIANATLRAPIPVPIIDLTLPGAPITEPTTITADVRADDDIEGVNFAVAGTEIGSLLDAEPFTFTIDPVAFPPGDYTLAVSALDSTGDIGTAGGTFSIAALPPALTFTPDLAALGTLTEPVTVTVDGGGQTPVTGVSIQFDGDAPVDLEAPYTFIIDPAQFVPGEHTVSVTALNEGGQTTTASGAFTAAALPPAVVISGLQDGQTVDRPVDITVTVAGQVPVSEVSVTVGGQPLEPNADNSYTIDPMTLPPGGTTITVDATLENGQSGTTSLNFLTAALPPQIFISGLTPGETLDASREIEINANSQTTVVHVAVLLDDAEVGHFTALPIPVTLDVLALGAGEHNLRIIADNASGQSSTLDVPFSVSEAPIATATQVANASATAMQSTQIVQATAAAVQATEFANATATQAQATSDAISTVSAQSTLAVNATATQVAGQTATLQANATSTQVAVLAVTQQFVDQQASTQAAADQAATNIARSTLDAAATEFAQATSTQVAAVTRGAQATATAEAGATGTAVAAATQAANLNATELVALTATAALTATEQANAAATQAAVEQATQEANASATAAAEAQTATVEANASATQAVNLTATAQNTVDARETARAQIGATSQVETRSALETRAAQTRLEVQQTQDARATRDAATQAAQTEEANAQATQAAVETQAAAQTQSAVETATQAALEAETQAAAQASTQAAAETQSAVEVQTQEVQAAQTEETLVAQASTVTAETGATGTEAAAQTATADSANVAAQTAAAQGTATEDAQATATAQANATIEIRLSAVGPTPTPVDGGAQSASSPTPAPTLVPQQTETAPFSGDIIPILIIALVLIILLIVIVLILRRR